MKVEWATVLVAVAVMFVLLWLMKRRGMAAGAA